MGFSIMLQQQPSLQSILFKMILYSYLQLSPNIYVKSNGILSYVRKNQSNILECYLKLYRNRQQAMLHEHGRHTVHRGQIAQHILDNTLQNLLVMDMNFPILQTQPKFIEQQPDGKLLETASQVDGVLHTLRVLRMRPKKTRNKNHRNQSQANQLSKLIFCRPVKQIYKDEKVFWLIKDQYRKKINLDLPIGVLVLPNSQLLTVQRKYINLYEIEDDLTLSLKDFDSTGIGKRITLVDIKCTSYKKKDYVMIFRNQKQNNKIIFQALIYEIKKSTLRFVKKSNIIDRQVISPTILFDQYRTDKTTEKFCLILGGRDSTDNCYYEALQINLHIFLNDFLTYDSQSTMIIPFNRKVVVLSGKAIKYEHKWYLFCSQEQTINEIVLQYEGNGTLAHLEVKSERLDFNQKFYFSEDSVHNVYDEDQEKVIFVHKNLSLKFKSLNKIIWPLNN